jgi:hypothetical protein
MLINGIDLAGDGFILTSLSGWSSPPAWQRSAAALPNIHGVVPALYTTTTTREIKVGLRYYCATLAARFTALQLLEDRLAGLLVVRFDDALDRFVRCVASAITVTSMDPGGAFAIPGIEIAFSLIAYDGASYDLEPRVYLLTSQIPLGTLPSGGIITMSGSWSVGVARTLICRAATGLVVGSLTLTPPSSSGGLGANDYFEIDLSRQYATKITSTGVRTNAYAWKTAGDWFVLDPAYADRSGFNVVIETPASNTTLLLRQAYAL